MLHCVVLMHQLHFCTVDYAVYFIPYFYFDRIMMIKMGRGENEFEISNSKEQKMHQTRLNSMLFVDSFAFAYKNLISF